MQFIGSGQPLTNTGLQLALQQAGLEATGQRYIWTICEVETGDITQGLGFCANRSPQMLFERHIFRRLTNKLFDSQAPDLSGAPGGYGSLASQYDRMERALALCDAAGLGVEPALQAASWGIGQIMGFQHADAGFDSAELMVAAFVRSEDLQLLGMMKFLHANGLTEALQSHDWAAFARGYNGSNFAINRYDVRLANQYERFASGSGPRLDLRCAQAALTYLGFAPGAIDGVLGSRTQKALAAFRMSAGLPVNDGFDQETYQTLCTRAGIQPC